MDMRIGLVSWLVLGPLLVGLAFPADPDSSGSGGESPHLTWYAEDGTVAWRAALAPAAGAASGGGADPVALHARPWFPPAPPVRVRLLEGTTVDLRAFAGKVLILDFWATWCPPCAQELPWLQGLQETERERGLEVLTVNMREADALARRFTEALGVGLPIGRYDEALDEAFHVKSMPTVIVIDREQRVRARFNGYADGIEEKIADLARALLEPAPESGPVIAHVLHGSEALEVGWSRPAAATVRGLAVRPAPLPTDPRILAATGWDLTGYGADGDEIVSLRVWPGVDRLRFGEAGSPALGFRPAGSHVVPLALDGEAGAAWEAPAPVLDVRVDPPHGDEPPTVLLATVRGVHRVALDGTPLAAREDLGLVVRLGDSAGRPIALGSDGRLSWLGADLATVREWRVPTGSRLLVGAREASGGLGVAPAVVEAAVVGKLLDGGGSQIALAADDGLRVIDLDSGRERFRARWPRIAALATGDLDGDGRDELLVGSGKQVTTLHRPVDLSLVSP
jgi:thiol-disulfide isomerase/thioredoxin